MAIVAVEARAEVETCHESRDYVELVGWLDTVWIEIQFMFQGDTADLTCDAVWEHRWKGRRWQ